MRSSHRFPPHPNPSPSRGEGLLRTVLSNSVPLPLRERDRVRGIAGKDLPS
jgi:hypothetical protein